MQVSGAVGLIRYPHDDSNHDAAGLDGVRVGVRHQRYGVAGNNHKYPWCAQLDNMKQGNVTDGGKFRFNSDDDDLAVDGGLYDVVPRARAGRSGSS